MHFLVLGRHIALPSDLLVFVKCGVSGLDLFEGEVVGGDPKGFGHHVPDVVGKQLGVSLLLGSWVVNCHEKCQILAHSSMDFSKIGKCDFDFDVDDCCWSVAPKNPQRVTSVLCASFSSPSGTFFSKF